MMILIYYLIRSRLCSLLYTRLAESKILLLSCRCRQVVHAGAGGHESSGAPAGLYPGAGAAVSRVKSFSTSPGEGACIGSLESRSLGCFSGWLTGWMSLSGIEPSSISEKTYWQISCHRCSLSRPPAS